MLQLIGKFYFWLTGWKIVGQLPEHPKYIIIGGPHTSNWDFIYAIMAKFILKLEMRYLGKDTLFRFPHGWFFRMLGGIPVKRDSPHNMVEQMVQHFDQNEKMVLALAPEGTRSKVGGLRTGFWHIAKAAEIPIVMFYFDYAGKQFKLAPPFFTSDNKEQDLDKIVNYFRQGSGKRRDLEV